MDQWVDKMKKYWKIFWTFRRIQLMKMIEYRSDFWFWMIVSLMWTGFNYFYFGLIFTQGNGVKGWSYDQILLLISFYTMLDAFTWSVFYPNMRQYTEEVFNGELSKYLLLPVNNIFILLTSHATYHNVPRFLVGLGVLIHTVNKLNLSLTFLQIVLVLVLFCFSILLLYSCWFILATFSFWVERLRNINEIMPQFRSVYQVPLQVYTGITGLVFTFLLPLGLVTTLPSEVLLGKIQYQYIIFFCCMSVLFFTASVKFYKVSIKKYISVGG